MVILSNSPLLVSVDEPAFLDAKKTVMAMSSRGSPIPEPSEPFTSTYPDYISVSTLFKSRKTPFFRREGFGQISMRFKSFR